MKYPWHQSYPQNTSHEVNTQSYQSVVEVIESGFRQFAHLPAFTNMGTTLTYSDIEEASGRFASFLQNELKLKTGDRVAIMLPNILQYPIALFGILRAGMVVVNVNPLYTARELEHQLKDSGAKTILIMANAAHTLEKIIGHTPIENVIVTEIGDQLSFPKSLIVNFVLKHVKKMVPPFKLKNAIKFNKILNTHRSQDFRKAEFNLDHIAFLQYTGGTTGVSKGAMLTHGNIVANICQAKEWLRSSITEGQEIIITPLPLYHIFSLTANCFIFGSVGAHNILITNPKDMPGFIKEIKKYPFTAFTGVNTLFNGLLNQPTFKTVDFSHLKISLGGGMAVQKVVAQKWKEVTGVPLIEAYGLTETSPAACINPLNISDYNGTIGLPICSTVMCIKNDDEQDLRENEIGEICIKGPQVMKGYWNRPDETEKVMTKDGFFKTGDIGFMNSQGFFKIVDRKKDMILVSGFNVFPTEIEEVICCHPKVLECAAIGVPDEQTGEAVKVFIVKKDSTLNESELRKYSSENFTGYKKPKHYEFRADLPKSNVGKILRKDLR
jgi:long-chain acyl-CoA synthetase